MIRRITLLPTVFALLLTVGLAFACSPSQPPDSSAPGAQVSPPAPASPAVTSPEFAPGPQVETTIRNVTNQAVRYELRPFASREPGEEKTLAPGAIDRVRTAGSLEISFSNEVETLTYTLDPGAAYSFRLDEDDRLQVFLGSHGRADAADLAPYVPTPMPVVDKMLEMAGVTAADILYDVGCGDGRIVITAAKAFGARGVGIDIDPKMVEDSRRNARLEDVEDLVRFLHQDAMKADLSGATVVALYLIPESNELLRPLLERQLRPGTRIVSHNYTIPGWAGGETRMETVLGENGEEHLVYLYIR